MESNQLAESALAYAKDLHWPVFPLAKRGKAPITPHGVCDATTDLERIEAWWRHSPEANIGIAMGGAGLLAVDVDRHGVDGELSLKDLERRHRPLPETVVALTGGGGRHLLFTAPRGVKLRQAPLAPGVDVRVGNGYIVAPPSVHSSGRPYAWDTQFHPRDISPAALPEWIADMLTAPQCEHPRAAGRVTDSVLGREFARVGWFIRGLDKQRAVVRCPWEAQHTTGQRGDTSTVLFAPTWTGGGGAFFCAHEHCRGRSYAEVLSALPGDEQWERLVFEGVRHALA